MNRSSYLGSADAKDLVSLEPYGCRRAMFYRKLEIEPDDPRETRKRETATEGPMVRGKELEPLILSKVSGRLGAEIAAGANIYRPEREWLRATPDGVVGELADLETQRLSVLCGLSLTAEQRIALAQPGVVEVKTVQSSELWRVRKEGPRADHVIQTQHQLAASGLAWALIVYLNADQWRWAFYLILRDEAWERESYLPACDAAWSEIQQARRMIRLADSPDEWDRWLPPRLKEGSKQCRTCDYRRGCWGMAYARVMDLPADGDPARFDEDPAWLAATSDLMAARELIEEAEAIKEAAEERIKALLGDQPSGEGGGVRIYWKPQTQKRLDTKALKAAHPEIAAKFEKETTTRPFKAFQV